MHRKPRLRFFTLPTLALAGLLLGACTTGQTPVELETTAAPSRTEGAVQTHALEQEQVIADLDNPIDAETVDPWALVDTSADMAPADANPLLLRASELFLDRQHYSTAYTLFEQVEPAWLNRQEQIYFALLRARYALLTGSPGQAQSLLNRVPDSTGLSRENQVRRLQLEIAIAAQQLDFAGAVTARMRLDPLLEPDQQLLNQSRILTTLTREQSRFRGDDGVAANAQLQGWLALAELNRNRQLLEPELSLWRQRFPSHPARAEELATITGGEISSRQIALLLPTSSRLGSAAQAFKAGFTAAIAASGQPDNSREYDIGAESELAGLYFQSAVNDGADFVIGPLGRSAAQSLLNHLERNPHTGVSTLLLGEIEAEYRRIPGLWGLSLSPEQDAAAIAERAISQGMRSAAVLGKDNDWGQRLAEAFTREFESRGGQVVVTQGFPPDKQDPTGEVKQLLRINSSDARHQRLENLLGTQLEFSVRRRDDIDFIFLAGNTRDARRLLPLVRFYRAHDLPVYATSSAFNGKFNKLTDEDLKGLEFVDLPWLLNLQVEAQAREQARLAAEKAAAEAQPVTPVAGQAASAQPVLELTDARDAAAAGPGDETLPYASATLNRLYALGYAAYQAIPQLSYLQSDQWYRFDTHTMSLNMDENNNLRHREAWGIYQADGIGLND